jgi:hypothetical protein
MAAPPFILLAKRILSISANSASCERLFSVFGNTLTKLRSRLGTGTLTNLAELKMFVRDQHRQGETKGRLKRVFKARTEVANPSEVQLVDATGSTNTLPPNTTDMETPAERAQIVVNETIQAQARRASNNFRSIVDLHAQLAAEDDLDREPVRLSSTTRQQIKLEELFDFTRTHWVAMYAKSPLRSFDEELELYELLDLDAVGEQDADLDVDDDTGDILTG